MRIAEVESNIKYWTLRPPMIGKVKESLEPAAVHDRDLGQGERRGRFYRPIPARVLRVDNMRHHPERRGTVDVAQIGDKPNRRSGMERRNPHTGSKRKNTHLVVLEVNDEYHEIHPGDLITLDSQTQPSDIPWNPPVASESPKAPPEESLDYVVHLGGGVR